jgi:hypothetical protein
MKLKSKPIFIVGTQRSGSNLLRLILNQSEQIDAPHPPHILQNFFPLLSYYGNLSQQKNFEKLVADVVEFVNRNPVKWHFFLDKNDVLNHCQNQSLLEVLKVIYQIAASKKNANYWCCKSMQNVKYIPEIEKETTDAFYIHLVRDGRDVATSFKNCLVGDKHAYFLAQTWKKEQELAAKHLSAISPERYACIRYEDMIENPQKTLSPVLEKLNINWSDALLNYYTSKEAFNTAKAGTMWTKLEEPLDPNNKKKYFKQLSVDEIRIFESVAKDILIKYGYEINFTENINNSFSTEDIEKFEMENIRLKKIAQEKFSDELESRRYQSEIIENVKRGSIIAP